MHFLGYDQNMLVYKDLLKEFISFKSISTDSQFQPEVTKLVSWLRSLFQTNNFDVKVIEGYANPIIVAHYQVDPSLDTCLIYGHYDVQPAEKSEGWFEDPFTLLEKDGRYYARGVVDNKGQVLVHIYNVLKLIEEGNLGYNIKFVIEGNEETGSGEIGNFLKDNQDLLHADFVMISDGEITMGHPSIEVSFRGVLNTTITIQTSEKDLHSGLYGGVAPSAAKELVDLLSKMVAPDGKILIPGFYDDVPVPDPKAVEANKSLPFDKNQYKTNTGTDAIVTEEGWDFFNQLAFRPTLQITGINSGYVGAGYRNAIPGVAVAKTNIRFSGEQDPKRLLVVIKDFVEKNTPSYATATVDFAVADVCGGVFLDISNHYVAKAEKLLEESFKNDVLHMYCGATLPIVVDFKSILNIPQVMVPLGNEDCNMHGANENYDIDILNKALTFSYSFFKKN